MGLKADFFAPTAGRVVVSETGPVICVARRMQIAAREPLWRCSYGRRFVKYADAGNRARVPRTSTRRRVSSMGAKYATASRTINAPIIKRSLLLGSIIFRPFHLGEPEIYSPERAGAPRITACWMNSYRRAVYGLQQ
jgi:hypothetical protein